MTLAWTFIVAALFGAVWLGCGPAGPYCPADCQSQYLGTSEQNLYQRAGGMLYVTLTKKHPPSDVQQVMDRLGGNVECLNVPRFAEMLASQRCYVIRMPTYLCVSDARRQVKENMPDAWNAYQVDPVDLCSCRSHPIDNTLNAGSSAPAGQ